VHHAQNHLIELLPAADRRRLLARCDSVPLAMSAPMGERGDATLHAYFPVDGFISLMTPVDEHPGLEVGLVGREGMLGAQLSLGVAVAPLRALVQGAGSAWRMASADFLAELARSPPLQSVIQRYVYVRMSQLAVSAACLRYHQIGPRLARWLLMSQDRAHTDRLRVTHEFLAYMLGVRRVGITTAASGLQRRGLIEYHRGDLSVVNRTGLEAAACPCYAADRQVYREWLA
jgi:CRP-like cAMP-binding protein